MLREMLTLLFAFAVGTAVAEALGASNLGTALAFGQIAFAVALVWTLLRGGRPGVSPKG
jgi:hypothetical protein